MSAGPSGAPAPGGVEARPPGAADLCGENQDQAEDQVLTGKVVERHDEARHIYMCTAFHAHKQFNVLHTKTYKKYKFGTIHNFNQ